MIEMNHFLKIPYYFTLYTHSMSKNELKEKKIFIFTHKCGF